MSLSNQLSAGLNQLGLEVSSEQHAAFLTYLELIQKWNRSFNLVADSHPQQLLKKHLLDCLAVLKQIEIKTDQLILDVGSGAGFPGIPWAIVHPKTRFVLLDSNGKKTRFLFQVKTELRLENVTVEKYGHALIA